MGKILDMTDFLKSLDILYSQELNDDYKLKYFSYVFGENITDENVEYLFKKWLSNNFKSSNVKKIQYNDETKEMVIQFQDKSIYTYFDVSFDLFLKVSGGEASCITSGENKYGSWWVGKNPSRGAATFKYLVKAGVKYVKGGSFK